MTVGMKMFLLAAQELNFTRAAHKAYVTPQCLSDHIRRLESEYDVQLFERRPQLELTAEGRAMLRCFTEMQALEANMVSELSGICSGARGTVRLGIPATRGRLFIPTVVPAFQQQYPNVQVQVQLGDTRRLEPQLAEGKLDLVLGVDANPNPLFSRVSVCKESLYAVVPAALLRRQYGDAYSAQAAKFGAQGIAIEALARMPLVLANGISTTAAAIEAFLLRRGVQAQSPIVVSNFDILLELCLSGSYATICLASNLGRLLSEEQRSRRQQIYAFALADCDVSLSVELLTRSYGRRLPCQEVLSEMLKTALLAENDRVNRWLAHQWSDPL